MMVRIKGIFKILPKESNPKRFSLIWESRSIMVSPVCPEFNTKCLILLTMGKQAISIIPQIKKREFAPIK